MTRERLDHQIRKLKDDVLLLGSMVEKATLDAVDALKRRDADEARRIYLGDVEINEKRFEIEQDCLITIATQQPMAHDLRILAAVLEIITELERMGDYAKGIARICLMTANAPLLRPLTDIPKMAELAVDMLHRALEAFNSENPSLARTLPKEDDAVDDLYNTVQRALLDIMIKDPSTVDRANHLLWAAHNLERLADRVINICERTIFVATGEMDELDVSDDESLLKLD
jgi:phosphate transport system protein